VHRPPLVYTVLRLTLVVRSGRAATRLPGLASPSTGQLSSSPQIPERRIIPPGSDPQSSFHGVFPLWLAQADDPPGTASVVCVCLLRDHARHRHGRGIEPRFRAVYTMRQLCAIFNHTFFYLPSSKGGDHSFFTRNLTAEVLSNLRLQVTFKPVGDHCVH